MNPFVPDTRLTAIALGYRNASFIADMVAPRVPVPTEEFRYSEFTIDEMFNIPNTMVGRKSETNDVEFTSTEKSGMTHDWGLSDKVPQKDIDNAKTNPSFDPLGVATTGTMELVALAREKRVADMCQNAANYNHTAALTGADKFSDLDSDAANIILEALEVPLVRPNQMTLGRKDWFNLRRNRSLIQHVKGDLDAAGIATKMQIAEVLELENIHIGEARYNTANKGQAMSLSRLWGGSVSFQYNKPFANLTRDVTFITTAQFQDRVSYTEQLKPGRAGLRGGLRVTVGEQLNELIIAKEAGYLLTGTQ